MTRDIDTDYTDLDDECEAFLHPRRPRSRAIPADLFYVRVRGDSMGPFDPDELNDVLSTLRGSYRIVPA